MVSWFSRNNEQPTQQFGAPSTMGNGYAQNNSMGMGMGRGMADPMVGFQQAQKPMMAQFANDPVMATAKLISHNDPMANFIAGNNMGYVMNLFGDLIMLSLKNFFDNVQFKDEDGKILSIDTSTMPTQISTLSPENISLTLQTLQNVCQQTVDFNKQQTQMLLMSHNPMMMGDNQPGFFGSLLGGLAGQTLMQRGGMGAMGAAVV